MKLVSPQKELYGKDRLTALQAQRLAQEIAFAPIVFQISRLMIKLGIFQQLLDHKEGLTAAEIIEKTKLSPYAVQILLESSLAIGTIITENEKFFITKAGYFLTADTMTKVNLEFNHDVNYLGLFRLEEALLHGKPEGLKVFGEWETIYEGLSQLPPQVQESWFHFDHYYSDCSFAQALEIVFAKHPKTLLDVGGNTGRFASQCVAYEPAVNVTIMDLPQQLEMMRQQTQNVPGAERIHGHAANLLSLETHFPTGFDAIWMSQFLDCFSNEEVVNILSRAAAAMSTNCRLYIMETVWDRQRFETSSYCLAQISVYFTAMANGNSKMFNFEDLENNILLAGLEIEQIYDNLGKGHAIFMCRKK